MEDDLGARIVLTMTALEAAKPAAPGARALHWDALVPSLALRVTDKGHKSFIVQRRVNGRMRGPAPALKTARERQKWERCRWLLDGHDACWATREAILEGDWIDAINWAMMAGSRLSRDRAATGRARGGALSNPNKRTRYSARLAKRNALILRRAAEMRERNSVLRDSDVAALLAGKTIDGLALPSGEAIRKILHAARKAGNI